MKDSAKSSRAAPYPGFIEPCHPAERGRPPSGGTWIHEIKADGRRAQVHIATAGAAPQVDPTQQAKEFTVALL